MTPFEALYGQPVSTPLWWQPRRDQVHIGPELLVQNVEQIQVVKEKLKAAQDRQKKYADLSGVL